MKELIFVTFFMLSCFIINAQKVDSVRIYYDSLGTQSVVIFANNTVPYFGKLNKKDVEARINAVGKFSEFASVNDSLSETVSQINKEILEEEKKNKTKNN